MLIGYARVSTDDQLLDLQQDALTKVGCERIFTDRESGAKATRPGLTLALDMLRADDTLVVWRLDRLGRSLKNLIELTELLRERSIQLHSIQDGIDTSTSGGQLMFHLFGALAEFERNLIRERTNAGLTAARTRGKTGGRPKALAPNQRALVVSLYKEKQHSLDEICQMMGISRPTLYSYVAEEQNSAPQTNPRLGSS
ncbi:recombinase family protein [Chamaesiphon minutus]|uniref:Site-specific recombinase, DNA invertase Pin n=1 Tax=Chamaesiphon minutus (strain ATCC 27169 / PCC 6605) TaxID=1173020 RepID=K9URA3_CHAP6|nr:recombinase family protein [Chamaesiphon minutus]AFY96991.1 site-specific recombinase, DNA invertase Pin [Chamaesiphon minutus PCC 6605]